MRRFAKPKRSFKALVAATVGTALLVSMSAVGVSAAELEINVPPQLVAGGVQLELPLPAEVPAGSFELDGTLPAPVSESVVVTDSVIVTDSVAVTESVAVPESLPEPIVDVPELAAVELPSLPDSVPALTAAELPEAIEVDSLLPEPISEPETTEQPAKQPAATTAIEPASKVVVPQAIEAPDLPVWDVSKSKVATPLDPDYISHVTLGLPSTEIAPVTDVVFVLDRSGSMTSKGIRDAVTVMLEELAEDIKDSDATVNVGVVGFDYEAFEILPLTKLEASNMDTIKNAIADTTKSGTNIEAGIVAGSAMLEKGTAAPGNKYMVLITDGISHAWNGADGKPETLWGQGVADSTVVFNGANSYYYFDTTKDKFSDIYALDANDTKLNSRKEVPVVYDEYGNEIAPNDASQYLTMDEYDTYLSGVEKGVYTAAQAYAEAAKKYRMITAYWTSSSYPVAKEFMEWTATLNEGHTYNLDEQGVTDVFSKSVLTDLTYLVDAGSSVEDYMGYSEEDGYNFDFVNDPNKLVLTVGGEKKTCVPLGNNTYGFGKELDGGKYEYMLTYHPGEGADEHFVWEINVPVSNFEQVLLTYDVQLVNPKTEAGTYGEYDADGSKGLDGLFTNTEAILYPVKTGDTEPSVGEYFNRPTVSYVVAPTIVIPGGEDPDLPGGPASDDPYIRAEEPVAPVVVPVVEEVEQPAVVEPAVVEEPVAEQPAAEQPAAEQPAAPAGPSAPKSGDSTFIGLWAVMGVLALGGVALVNTKKFSKD